MKGTALFSLNDTSRAVEFARLLINAGWKIIASNETARVLREENISVIDVADFTDVKENFSFPPTLHPKIELALTADCENRIDLVYILTYPLSDGSDVGGHTILALAAKGRRIPVMNNKDMEVVVKEIVKNRIVSQALRNECISKANYVNAKHYANIISNQDNYEMLLGIKSYNLLNGENPYQVPASAFTSEHNDSLSLLNLTKISGEEPCFTNIANADCILQTLCLSVEAFQLNIRRVPYICIAAKHGNACGMGISFVSPEFAIKIALWGNPRSIWGGEVITNFLIDKNLAGILLKSSKRKEHFDSAFWMLDLIIAPSFSSDAISILGTRKKRKLFENGALTNPSIGASKNTLRMIRGGFLRQPSTNYILNLKECSNINVNNFTDNKIVSIIIAWVIAFTSNHGGNEVVIAKDNSLLGAGGGPSTLEAASIAIKRARECGHNCANATFAADAFFPFDDAPKILIQAGCTEGIVPSGGKMFKDIKKYFADNNIACGFIPEKYRGFCRH
jgi:phosphoribosylaminoimidazolecarboxamide formyltransferase/IMP cyclohydrolase